MSATTLRNNPSLAQVVREETDNGRLIVQFYLGVAYGSIEGFRDHHRAAAARRIDKIAPGLVREYLTKHHNQHVRESMRHTLFPMGTIAPLKKGQPEPRGPNPFQRRLSQIIRQETGDGRNIVNFLIDAMNGALTGFKPHHRLEAAQQLTRYITLTPSPSPSAPSAVNPSPPKSSPSVPSVPSVVHPSSPKKPSVPSVPSVVHPSSPSAPSAPSAVNPPITRKDLELANYQPHHIDQYHFARDEITGTIYAFDDDGPLVVDEEGAAHRIDPNRIVGYERAVRDARARTRREERRARTRLHRRNARASRKTRARRAGNNKAPAQPDPPSSTPSRSPPRFRL